MKSVGLGDSTATSTILKLIPDTPVDPQNPQNPQNP
jgi:hypothetical protein